ncbi:uncharacterized protein LOC120301403 isoform X1 [Crotalus tigris]|uniref:uncharacterized protein LOC120301403 isoform X1 n=1 Tax=Crotalus tigris TaxID=88082 RepID=UPI00192F275C|nr:uncharacterized protein LOC120301403 isoform X1 [Crotalus tigris]
MPDRRGAEERRCRRRRRRRGKFRPARRACGEAGRGLRSAPGCGKLPPPDTPPPPRFASLRRSPCSRRSTLAIRGPPLRLERGSPCRAEARRPLGLNEGILPDGAPPRRRLRCSLRSWSGPLCGCLCDCAGQRHNFPQLHQDPERRGVMEEAGGPGVQLAVTQLPLQAACAESLVPRLPSCLGAESWQEAPRPPRTAGPPGLPRVRLKKRVNFFTLPADHLPRSRKKRKENSCSLTNLLLNFYTMVLISWSAGAMLLKGGEHQLRPVLPLLWKGCTQASFRLLQQQVVECWLLAA